jgi:hypothetical protein
VFNRLLITNMEYRKVVHRSNLTSRMNFLEMQIDYFSIVFSQYAGVSLRIIIVGGKELMRRISAMFVCVIAKGEIRNDD